MKSRASEDRDPSSLEGYAGRRRDYPNISISDVRVLLRRFMHRRYLHPSHVPSFISSIYLRILRAIKELTVGNTTYTSPAYGKSYDFNTADKMNELLTKSLLGTGGLRSGQEYEAAYTGKNPYPSGK